MENDGSASDGASRGSEAMVRAGVGWLRERGAVKAQLMVRSTNEGAVSFYESLGFEEQEVTVLGRRLSP